MCGQGLGYHNDPACVGACCGDRVEGLAEVQDHHISLDSGVIRSEEVLHGGEQLGLRGMSRSEAVVSITKYVVLFQVVPEVSTNDVFKQLASYRRQ